MVDAGENVLAVFHFESLFLLVSVMQSHRGGKWWRQGRGWGTDGHWPLQGMWGRCRGERGDGWQHAPFLSIQHYLRSVRQPGFLPDAGLMLVFVLRAAVAQICNLQVWVWLRVQLHPSSPLRGGLPACPCPGSEADGSQPQTQRRGWRIGLRSFPQWRPVANVCPTQWQAPGVRWHDESDWLTTRCAVCPSGLPRRCSPLTPTCLPWGEQGGEGVRQLGKAALQRVWVKLGGVEGARGQFGAVIEGEGPWEVGVEAPGVVEGWVAGVRAQQWWGFGVARCT